MTSPGGIAELEQTVETLRDLYGGELRRTRADLDRLRTDIESEEWMRDRLLRESKRIFTRAEAAGFTGLSTSRVEQIVREAA